MSTVLMCGGNSCSEIVRSISRGFQKIGCTVVYQATRHKDANGIRCPKPELEKRLANIVREHKPDMLFWALCKWDCPEGLIATLRALRPEMKTVFHSFDDPYQIDENPVPNVREFAYAVTCCEGSVPWYKQQSVKAVCLYPPADHDLHAQARYVPELSVDFAFVGTQTYPKERYPHVLADRRDVIRKAASLGSLSLYGYWGERRFDWGGQYGAPELKPSFKGFLKFEMQPHVYLSSKVNLCTHVRPDGDRYLNERAIYVLASGGFLLMDHVANIEKVFEPGVHVETWKTLGEFEEKAARYLKDAKARVDIANAGRRLVWQKYSNVHHAQNVFKLCGLTLP